MKKILLLIVGIIILGCLFVSCPSDSEVSTESVVDVSNTATVLSCEDLDSTSKVNSDFKYTVEHFIEGEKTLYSDEQYEIGQEISIIINK